MNRIRWLILLLGPWPIIGSAWVVSAWFQSGPRTEVVRNDAILIAAADAAPLQFVKSGARRAPAADDSLAQECQAAADKLKGTLGSECHVRVAAPFVLAGDLSAAQLDEWHSQTIAPAVRAMQNTYLRTAPNKPVTVLLFSGEQSYNRYCRRLFDDGDISIYGYYKPNLRTLVLNVGTGGGTLVHELTHALVDFDFPDLPDWFNEGLASLHEQCRFRSGDQGPWIEGLVNWRLKGLEQVAREGRLRSLRELIEDRDFRGRLQGTNYAQARYFCLYLQQQGLLERFYREFRAARADDPRGLKTVASLFPDKTWQQLDQDFQQWVLELRDET